MADDPRPAQGARLHPAAIGVAILVIALVLFIVQNTGSTSVSWLVFDWRLPLWLLLVITSAIAIVAAELAAFVTRRRRH